MSGGLRIDHIEVELEELSAARAEIVAAAISGALAGQLAAWPLQLTSPRQQPQGDDASAGERPDVDAIAAEIAARILQTLAVERERNSEEAGWP
ncbi:MAG: hypothetical protein ABI460_17055 [Caldimonas sp.]